MYEISRKLVPRTSGCSIWTDRWDMTKQLAAFWTAQSPKFGPANSVRFKVWASGFVFRSSLLGDHEFPLRHFCYWFPQRSSSLPCCLVINIAVTKENRPNRANCASLPTPIVQLITWHNNIGGTVRTMAEKFRYEKEFIFERNLEKGVKVFGRSTWCGICTMHETPNWSRC